MSKNFRLIVPCLVALCSLHLCAQPRVMGIDELFRLADANIKTIQAFATGNQAAADALKAAKAFWFLLFSTVLNIALDLFFILSLGWGVAGAAIATVFAQAVSVVLSLLLIRRKRLAFTVRRQDVRFQLVGYYLDLYKLNNQAQVLEKNLALALQVIADMQARREQGTALQNDITRYEFQKENLKLQLAKVNDACKIVNHRLVTILHLPEETVVVPDTTLLATEVQTLSENDWQELATQTNIDLRQAATGIETSKQLVKRERSERLPKVSLFAAEHLDGPITIEVPVLDNNFNYWYVGVSVSYNFSSLFKNTRKLKQARLNVRRAQETHGLAQEQVENAVQASYTSLLTAFTELRTQEKNVQLANENYSVTSNRYRNELALLTDMLDAGNTKLSADLALVNARIDLVYHYYQMRYVTHTL